jgi:hypothetical protein
MGMNWPWVSRRELEEQIEVSAGLGQFARDKEATIVDLRRQRDFDVQEWEARNGALEEKITEMAEKHEAERRMLFDRMMLMAGQPALYQPAQPVTAAPQQEKQASTGPALRIMPSFEGVHEAYRQARSEGKV